MRGWLAASLLLALLPMPASAQMVLCDDGVQTDGDCERPPGQPPWGTLNPGCQEGEACDNEGPLCQGPDFYVYCDPHLAFVHCADGHWHAVCPETVPQVPPVSPPVQDLPTDPSSGVDKTAEDVVPSAAPTAPSSTPVPPSPNPTTSAPPQDRPAPERPRSEARYAPAPDEGTVGRPDSPDVPGTCTDSSMRWGPVLPMPVVDAPRAPVWASGTGQAECDDWSTEPGEVVSDFVATGGPSNSVVPGPAGGLFTLVAVGVGLAAAAVAFGWAWTARAATAVALYTRLGAGRVLRHPDRARIVAAVVAEPGLELASLLRGLEMRPSTAAYHVRVLSHFGHVRVERHAGRTCLLPSDPKLRAEGRRLGLLRRPALARVHEILRANPGMDQAALAVRLGVRQQSVSKTLARLTAAGLVQPQDGARPTRYLAVTDAPRVA